MISLKTGKVRAIFSQGGRTVQQTALMIGFPTVFDGNTYLVEILTSTGRSTLVPKKHITALDDHARALLRGSTSKRR